MLAVVPQIPRETVEQVLAATDIVDLIGSYIPVKRAGARFTALCPFHNEKTPSFSIDPARQFFHCFGCKKSGDAIGFVRDYENLTFVDSVRKLASRVGVEVVEQAPDPREEADRRRRGRLLDLHREVSRYYHRLLMRSRDAEHARAYLKSRGFGSEMAKRWEIGWAPPPATFAAWARQRQLRGRDLVDAGIALAREQGGLYFRFRDRLMFPIRNDHGDVIAFSGRQLQEDPRSGKYINSPETALFKKSSVLFALDRSRKAILDRKAALLCEGQIDAIACHEHGIEHAIAPLGTAFTPQHARHLKRYTKQALLCFDADSAGFTAAERAFRELATEGVAVRVVRMPPGEDPDTFIGRHGIEAFQQLLDAAPDFFDFLIERARDDGRLEQPQSRAAFTRDCAPLLARLVDPVARDAMIQHVATRLQAGTPELRREVERAARRQRETPRWRRDDDDASAPPPPAEPSPLDPTLGYLCCLALRSAEAQEWLAEQLETLHELGPHLDGCGIALRLLAERPDPERSAGVNAFLGGLDAGDRLALESHPAFAESLPAEPRQAAEEALAACSAIALERQDAAIKAALAEPGLAPERQLELLTRAKEIAELLAALPNRALTTDRFGPSRRRTRPEDGPRNAPLARQRNP